jgi:3-deoxy-D-manno-octulosonic-acid transferase
MLALKLIRKWLVLKPGQRFVLATGTATGHQVGTAAAIPEVRVTYVPLDFKWMVRRYIKRFSPSQIVLIEGEAWPHLLLACRKRKIPVSLVNARVSPRSGRRYRRFAVWLKPLFSMLDAVAIQEPEDAEIWQTLGVETRKIHHTGSLKFDPDGGAMPMPRPEFQQMLDAFGDNRPIILAASTHAGEDAWIASSIRDAAPHALPVIVPRHAERRSEVRQELGQAGFKVVLRSKFDKSLVTGNESECFIIDSTGELRDWTAHADVVIIGKSFLSTGGQNPSEAILARKPVVFGPYMENFEPLATRLTDARGALRAMDAKELSLAITQSLDSETRASMTARAFDVLSTHKGATRRILALLNP